uniref:DNA damage-regulated autophagy modulator protein 2 n=1 Tax=Steinernema glaseri TaxID=37863 RepID=A0A1I7XXX6_9BILA
MLQCGKLGAGHIPVVFGILFTFMLGTTYVFAVWHRDVDPVFPYISSSGDQRPESCIFSLLLNFCAFLIALIIYLRFGLVKELNRDFHLSTNRLNILALWVGITSSMGMFLVANFQETAVIQIHMTGAIICFGGSCVYMLLHAAITWFMYPTFVNRPIAFLRTGLAVVASTLFVISLSCGILAAHKFHAAFPDKPTPRPWSGDPDQPGFELHCISAVAEWALAIVNMLYILSYSRDFEKIRVQLRVQPLVFHLGQSPLYNSLEDLTI